MPYVAVIRVSSDEEFYCLLTENREPYQILGWQTEDKALAYFEKAYNNAHAGGSTWSTGAMLHFIQLKPAIIKVMDEKDIEERLLGPGPDWNVVSGFAEGRAFVGMRCEAPTIKEEYDAGKTPRLIS